MLELNTLKDQARKNLIKYDYDEVSRICDRILELYPDSYFGLFFKGVSYFQTKKFKEALPYLEKLYSLYPDNEDAISNLVFVYKNLGKYDQMLPLMKKNPKI